MRIFRNIIVVDIQDIYTQPKIKFSRDVYAAPQMIMTIQAPDEKEFADFVEKNKQVIIDFFVKSEINRQINLLKEKHNDAISAKVGSMFDCDVWLKEGYPGYKVIKNSSPGFYQPPCTKYNFVIYSYPYTDRNTFTKEFFVHKRDSVMKANIPGERERYIRN